MNKKIYVGLSGGVDSAVSAALLKRDGYNVMGVFIKIWSPEFLECTWREDRLDAMRVAAHLEIPFLEIDLSHEYRNHVVEDMLTQYKKGRTPNPDVLCNEYVKFGAFAGWAFKNGADYIATGHYARAVEGKLLKGVDPSKDQSYFLYRIKRVVLERTLFPVGGFTKIKIRELAQEFALPNAERPDSQGLCFVGDVTIPEFLARFITLKKGQLVDENGKVIGEHDGAALYTLGQRHGYRLLPDAPPGPYYVTTINSERNEVHVSKTKKNTEHAKATIDDLHWIGEPRSDVEVAARYHGKSVRGRIDDSLVTLKEPTLLTPGQSLVFYDGEECLGGAVIHSVE